MLIIALVEFNRSACNDIVGSVLSEHIATQNNVRGAHAVSVKANTESEEVP
jgi:hypothetical protein